MCVCMYICMYLGYFPGGWYGLYALIFLGFFLLEVIVLVWGNTAVMAMIDIHKES